MLKPIIAWLLAFLFCLALGRTAVSSWADRLTAPFPNYDSDAIAAQVKGRTLDRLWLAVAIASSSLIAAAMAVRNDILMGLLAFSGWVLIIFFTSVRGYRLFHTALTEMGLPWPPPARADADL